MAYQWRYREPPPSIFQQFVTRVGFTCTMIGWVALLTALVLVPLYGVAWHAFH